MIPLIFEVDCGEVLPGHRMLATGLRNDGVSDDDLHADYSAHTADRPVHAMASLTYVITPTLPESESRRDVDATVRLDPPPDPRFWDPVLVPGAERSAVPGAVDTVGAFGPFVVPEATETVTARLVDVAIVSGGAAAPVAGPPRELGDLIVDLRNRTARWEPSERGDASGGDGGDGPPGIGPAQS